MIWAYDVIYTSVRICVYRIVYVYSCSATVSEENDEWKCCEGGRVQENRDKVLLVRVLRDYRRRHRRRAQRPHMETIAGG